MSKQISIRWGIQNYQNNEYELTVGLNNEQNTNYYNISLESIEDAATLAANEIGISGGFWDLNQIYGAVDTNNNMYRDDEKIYIKKGFDETKGNQDNTEFPFGQARLEYFIPSSNNNSTNNNSSDDDMMGDGFVFGGGKGVKRKRTRHTFVGKKVASLPLPSQQSKFYKKTKADIEKATANFLEDEKNRKNNRLPFTPDEEALIMEATNGGGKSLLKKKRTKSLLKKKRTKRRKKKRTKRRRLRKSRKKRMKTKRKRGRKSPKRRRR